MAVDLRLLRRGDFPVLAGWLGAEHVARFWREPADLPSLEARYGPAVDGTDPTEVFVAEVDGHPIGLAQRYLIDDYPEWQRALTPARTPSPAAGIDYLIGEEALTGGGLGRQMVAELVEASWERYPDLRAVVAAVQQANRPSWRLLEHCGFERIWSGQLDSTDPGDDGPAYVYRCWRPG